MSEEPAAAGLVGAGAAAVEMLGEGTTGDGREGVAAGVTLRGSAAEDGGAMALVCGVASAWYWGGVRRRRAAEAG